MMNVQGRKKHMTSAQIIIFGFMVVIFMGALLLMLPISTKGPVGRSIMYDQPCNTYGRCRGKQQIGRAHV